MKFLFLKLIKAREKMLNAKDNRNFGLLLKCKENLTPVTNFFGTLEGFSQLVDNDIFKGSLPQNFLEKFGKSFDDGKILWYIIDLKVDQFAKVVEFLYTTIQGKDVTIQAKDATIQATIQDKDQQIQEKNLAIQATIQDKDQQIQEKNLKIKANEETIQELTHRLNLLESKASTQIMMEKLKSKLIFSEDPLMIKEIEKDEQVDVLEKKKNIKKVEICFLY